jgi:hypothetical protein
LIIVPIHTKIKRRGEQNALPQLNAGLAFVSNE